MRAAPLKRFDLATGFTLVLTKALLTLGFLELFSVEHSSLLLLRFLHVLLHSAQADSQRRRRQLLLLLLVWSDFSAKTSVAAARTCKERSLQPSGGYPPNYG